MTGVPAVAEPARPVAWLLLPVEGPVRIAVIGSQVAPGSWRWPRRWVDTVEGHLVVWCGERRKVAELPANTAAWVLAARLGCADLAERIGPNGDLAAVDNPVRAGHAGYTRSRRTLGSRSGRVASRWSSGKRSVIGREHERSR